MEPKGYLSWGMSQPWKFLWVLLVGLWPWAGFAQPTIVLGFGGYDHPMARIAEVILREAYQSIGYAVDLKAYPPERHLMMGNAGRVEGILFGGENIGEKYPNLAKIPVPLGYDDVVVFTKTVQFSVDGWQSLRPFRIGILIGMPEIAKHTAGMRIQAVPSARQLFLMLDLGRTDLVILPRDFGLMTLRGLGTSSVRILPGTLARLGLYHYLFRSDPRIQAITTALGQMERSGRILALDHQQASLPGPPK
jgi:polar amino acid transport system substrate-binding protein